MATGKGNAKQLSGGGGCEWASSGGGAESPLYITINGLAGDTWIVLGLNSSYVDGHPSWAQLSGNNPARIDFTASGTIVVWGEGYGDHPDGIAVAKRMCGPELHCSVG